MPLSPNKRSWRFRRSYGFLIRIGLLTAGAVLLFQVLNLLVMYRYVKLDYYLCLVAASFLAVGLLIDRTRAKRAAAALMVEKTTPEVLGQLSAKEWQVLKLVAEGKTNKEIAAVQFIELSTVKTHLNNIYGKLSVTNRNEARVKYAELATRWPLS